MMRSITYRQWMEWQVYATLAPFTEEREDIRVAAICSYLVNMQRDTKQHPKPLPLEEFILKFGDSVQREQAKPQTPNQIESYISMWVAGSNAVYREQTISETGHTE